MVHIKTKFKHQNCNTKNVRVRRLPHVSEAKKPTQDQVTDLPSFIAMICFIYSPKDSTYADQV